MSGKEGSGLGMDGRGRCDRKVTDGRRANLLIVIPISSQLEIPVEGGS